MESSDESPSDLAGRHTLRVAARGLNEVSLVLQHWIALEQSLREFNRETPSADLQPWLLGRTYSSLTLGSINCVIRKARDLCTPGVFSPWAPMMVEGDLRTLFVQTGLLYREVVSQLVGVTEAADQPWQDTSIVQRTISLLDGERERLFVLSQEMPGFRNQTRGEIVAMSRDDERLASDIVVPANDEGSLPEVVYMWVPTEEPNPDPTEPVRIEGVPAHSREAAKDILSTVSALFELVNRIQQEANSRPVVQAAIWASVTKGGADLLLSSMLQETRKAIDAVHSLFILDDSKRLELNRDLHELRRVYLVNSEQLLEVLGDPQEVSSSQRKFMALVSRFAAKLRHKLTD